MTCLPLILPGLPGLPVSKETVELLVDVNEQVCLPPQEICDWDGEWVEMSVAKIVRSGVVHFQDARLGRAPCETRTEAQMRRVWSRLVDADPKPMKAIVDGEVRNRLVISGSQNSDVQREITFVLADAIGVGVMKIILDVPFTAIKKRHGERHDFDVLWRNHKVRLETRGRFNRVNRSVAISDLDKKFKWPRDFHRGVGAVIYPSNKLNRSYSDIEITDPEGDTDLVTPADSVKHILEYYLRFFKLHDAGCVCDIQAAIQKPQEILGEYAQTGLPIFSNHGNYPPGRINYFGRTSLHIGGHRYIGSYYDGFVSPTWIRKKISVPDEGILFWGLAEAVLEQIGSPNILGLLLQGPERKPTFTDSGAWLFLFDDGILVAWAPSFDSLKSNHKSQA